MIGTIPISNNNINCMTKSSETLNHKGNFFSCVTKEYIHNVLEHKITAECFYSNFQENYIKISCADIIALVKDSNKDSSKKVIVIENFRYPVEKHILEFPSGIIDRNDFSNIKEIYNKISTDNNKSTEELDILLKNAIINGAKRELLEETGYTGTFNKFLNLKDSDTVKIFKNLLFSANTGNENAAVVMLDVDLDDKTNKNPKQILEKDELIKVHLVELDHLLEFITDKMEKDVIGCSSVLYYFALGMNFNTFMED